MTQGATPFMRVLLVTEGLDLDEAYDLVEYIMDVRGYEGFGVDLSVDYNETPVLMALEEQPHLIILALTDMNALCTVRNALSQHDETRDVSLIIHHDADYPKVLAEVLSVLCKPETESIHDIRIINQFRNMH